MATTPDSSPLVLDFDSHVLEPDEIWTDYLEERFQAAARDVFWKEEAPGCGTEIVLNGAVVPRHRPDWIDRAGSWRPGRSWDETGALDPRAAAVPCAGARDGRARLADLDAAGIAAQVVFPTYFGEYFFVARNPGVAEALARAYNRWIVDFCSADPARLLPAAVLPLQSVNASIREARRAAEAGIRVVTLRPMYFERTRFLNHPYFDPLWTELERLDLVAAVHPYPGSTNPDWSSHGPFLERVAGKGALPIGHAIAEVVAPIMDASTFLIGQLFYAFLDRHPSLRMVILHSKASWLPLILEKIEGYLTITVGTTIPVRIDAEEVFYGHGSIGIGFDADEQVLHAMPDLFSRVAVWGSRYPNHDAMAAGEAVERLRAAKVPEEAISDLMHHNGARLLGVGVPTPAGSRP